VAAIGVAALHSVGQRFDSLRQLAQFNTDLLRLRQHEQAFALRSDISRPRPAQRPAGLGRARP
jgi:methyl-accepting chemotaxis protein